MATRKRKAKVREPLDRKATWVRIPQEIRDRLDVLVAESRANGDPASINGLIVTAIRKMYMR